MRARRDEDGASAVEFALVVPLLTMLVFGIIAFGIVFAQSLALSNSARQAARSGVIEGTTCDQIVDLAKDSTDTIAMDGDDVDVTVSAGSAEATAVAVCGAPSAPSFSGTGSTQPCKDQPTGTNVYVRLDYTSELILPLVVVDDDFDLAGKGVFRCEFS
jgi:Flp pilus assembly protein TadG